MFEIFRKTGDKTGEGTVYTRCVSLESDEGRFAASDLTRRLLVKTEHQLYHIPLELINNAIKHANASQVTISLNHVDDIVELTIADNGVGFGAGGSMNRRGGVGLTNKKAVLPRSEAVFRLEVERNEAPRGE